MVNEPLVTKVRFSKFCTTVAVVRFEPVSCRLRVSMSPRPSAVDPTRCAAKATFSVSAAAPNTPPPTKPAPVPVLKPAALVVSVTSSPAKVATRAVSNPEARMAPVVAASFQSPPNAGLPVLVVDAATSASTDAARSSTKHRPLASAATSQPYSSTPPPGCSAPPIAVSSVW